MRAASVGILIRLTLPVLALTARLARLVEHARLAAVEAPLVLLLVPLLVLAWAPCRVTSLVLFTVFAALARPLVEA